MSELRWQYCRLTFGGPEDISEEEALADEFPETVYRRQISDWERLAPPRKKR